MMNPTPATFLDQLYSLREKGLIPRDWKRGHLFEHLEGSFKRTTINSLPGNYSISREGDGIGDSVKNGADPKAWRVGRGQFQLIKDPEDDVETQNAEMERALERAEELRVGKKRFIVRHTETPVPPPRPDRSGPQTRAALGSPDPKRHDMPASDRYPSVPITLTESERQTVAAFRTTERKALFIVLKHLVDEYGDQATIEEDRDGADLKVSARGKSERIEVKGTESPTIAWQQLKVSSQKSHDALENRDASMYRVVDVNGPCPRIYVLTYGRDFTLEPEPRWAVKRVPPKDGRYPLRGEPYRYDLPYDPVAADEWEVRE